MNKPVHAGVEFLQWALPKLGYRWEGFRKPHGQVLQRIYQRIHDLDLASLTEYKSFLENNPDEWKRLDQSLYVTISRFFRDRKLWDEFSENILPVIVKKHSPIPVRIWSAGCCNGEEPFSIAIAADKSGILDSVKIVATDRYPHLLNRAKAGRFPGSSLRELSSAERSRYFTYDSSLSMYVVDPIIRESVQFEQRNIRKSLPNDTFSIIFCRNLVFTYFSETEQLHFLSGIANILHDDGLLMIGANENLPVKKGWERVQKNIPVYTKTTGMSKV